MCGRPFQGRMMPSDLDLSLEEDPELPPPAHTLSLLSPIQKCGWRKFGLGMLALLEEQLGLEGTHLAPIR